MLVMKVTFTEIWVAWYPPQEKRSGERKENLLDAVLSVCILSVNYIGNFNILVETTLLSKTQGKCFCFCFCFSPTA